jgi:hypothetical protein
LGLAGLTRNTGDLLDAWADRFELILSKSSFGIGEALAHIPAVRDDGRRVLLFVDQFEELFQFADFWSKSKLDLVSAAERRDEATMFVRALLTAMKSPLLPIHIIVSMRSEFLGRCAGFHELPEAISWSPFLVPGMTRDQREDVIRKPVQLAGGQIDARLVQRALNDTNDDPDQLPNLQQTMMRCWERAYHREAGKSATDRASPSTIMPMSACQRSSRSLTSNPVIASRSEAPLRSRRIVGRRHCSTLQHALGGGLGAIHSV